MSEMNRRDVLRATSAAIVGSVAVAGSASAGDVGTRDPVECKEGCFQYCPDYGGCYCIC